MNIDNSNFILKPKNDYVFKKIFGDERNKDILIAFLKIVRRHIQQIGCWLMSFLMSIINISYLIL